jgi:hypothetical protein
VTLDGPALAPGVDLGALAGRMRANAAGAARVTFYWSAIQPDSETFTDLGAYDPIVLAAAREGIGILPVVLRAPAWARLDPADDASPPADPADLGALMTSLVARYGPNGTLWAEHPAIAPLTIRRWQVWNEPDQRRFLAVDGSWAPAYVDLLRAASRAVKAADPEAEVVSAGVTGGLDRLYAAGAKPFFDVAALHPYAATVRGVLDRAERARVTMRRHGDRGKALLLTSVTWSSGEGMATRTHGFEETEAGQARRVRRVLPALAAARKRLGLAGLYWYSWASRPTGSRESFDYCGLLRARGGALVAKPALRAWRESVRKLAR